MSKEGASVSILRKIVVDGFLVVGLLLCLFAIKLLWMPFQRGFFCDDDTLKLPYHEDSVTVLMLRIGGLGLPILVMVICEWALLRRERDDTMVLGVSIPVWIRGLYCVLVSFALGVCFIEVTNEVAKLTIGRLRPHFFEVCQPSVDCTDDHYSGIYIRPDDYSCQGPRGSKFDDMRKSFLSGHSSWAAFTMVFLALYLERRMIWSGTRALRHTLQFTALMLSWYTALSRVSDNKHHWSDVLAGYSVGAILAVLVWIWGTDLVERKKNHDALPQHEVIVIGQMQQNGHF